MYSYLALGDSYTIGEQVPFHQNFPNQTIQLLRNEGRSFLSPEIIAVTGYTSHELIALIDSLKTLPSYDFVTLLVGVNNQYRGLPVSDFSYEFKVLLEKAIQFAGGNLSRVFVLSIPDWGVTPFAAGKDRNKIAMEIDVFNQCCKAHAADRGVGFIEITTAQRQRADDSEYLAGDGLHPSGKEYAAWALLLAEAFRKTL